MNPTFFQNFTTTNGRTTRATYWLSFLSLFILLLLLAELDNYLNQPLVFSLPALIFSLLNLILMIRRAHDTGKSGWFTLIPIYNLILLFLPSQPTANRWGKVPTTTLQSAI